MTGGQLLNLVETGSVARYHVHLGNLLKTQDLSQHCYGVFWLCYALSFGRPSTPLLVAAMVHDAGEHRTGDMPGPVKTELGVRARMDAMEREFLIEKCGFEPVEIGPTDYWGILKLADALDGVIYCRREALLGNRTHAKVFYGFLNDALGKINALDDLGQPVYDRDLALSLYHLGKGEYDQFR